MWMSLYRVYVCACWSFLLSNLSRYKHLTITNQSSGSEALLNDLQTNLVDDNIKDVLLAMVKEAKVKKQG